MSTLIMSPICDGPAVEHSSRTTQKWLESSCNRALAPKPANRGELDPLEIV
jgi:hypothetical protein